MSFRTTLIIINLVAVVGLLIFIAYRVVSLRRNPEPEEPENLTPFFDDDVLEGPHLERVLGVSLVALVVAVVALVGYFIWEPFREADATDAFKDRSVERGELLFAGPTSPAFDSTKSLNCARCHGDNAQGGTATQVIKSTDPRCDLQAEGRRSARREPALLPAATGELGGTQPHARAAALQPRAAHADHHLRPAGHAHARVGREERQGRAQRAEHPGPRELPVQHRHHAREGPGGRGQGCRRHAEDRSRATRCGRRRRSGSPTRPPGSAQAQAELAALPE